MEKNQAIFEVQSYSKFSHSKLCPFRSWVVRSWSVRSWVVRSSVVRSSVGESCIWQRGVKSLCCMMLRGVKSMILAEILPLQPAAANQISLQHHAAGSLTFPLHYEEM